MDVKQKREKKTYPLSLLLQITNETQSVQAPVGPSHSSQPYEHAFTSTPAHSTTPLTAVHLCTGPPDQHTAGAESQRNNHQAPSFTSTITIHPEPHRNAGKALHIGNMFQGVPFLFNNIFPEPVMQQYQRLNTTNSIHKSKISIQQCQAKTLRLHYDYFSPSCNF